ncbi:hypothetical protein AVEN_102571-1 [Araneus ventricosus]|uniref:Uncharacterized protein n=1 Tax=Araneus ventricosus TaxID=182803 RepID=A0A4Y2BJ88_ARAVE|nr:hypothetical protein AVEN_102571-1 [Araneus ventricosus]
MCTLNRTDATAAEPAYQFETFIVLRYNYQLCVQSVVSLGYLKQCHFCRWFRTLLGLKVYYRTLSLENITERPAYSWETLVANIGDNLGFFMGLTVITFVELAELLYDLIIVLIKRHSTKTISQY